MDAIVRQIEFPCIVKPDFSCGASGIRRIASAAELSEAYRQTCRQFGPSCVQELIPPGGKQYVAHTFSGKDGTLHAAVVMHEIRFFPIAGGTGSLSRSVKRPDIVETCRRLLSRMCWSGIGNIDLVEDPRDGQLKVMENNPRPGGSIKVAFEAGVDFADLYLRHALDEDLPTYSDYREGVFIRHMPLDVMWFLCSPDRFRARPSWFRFTGRDLHYLGGSRDDPRPLIAGLLSGLSKVFHRSFLRGKIDRERP